MAVRSGPAPASISLRAATWPKTMGQVASAARGAVEDVDGLAPVSGAATTAKISSQSPFLERGLPGARDRAGNGHRWGPGSRRP